MVSISPFRALRPAAQFAREVASRPYDVLSVKEAKKEAEGKPNSFLHITRSEIDLPADVDVHSSEVYNKAKENLSAFVSREILFSEQKPCYYIYELTMAGRNQVGLVCCSSVEDYENGLIKKHEFTRPEKEQDRVDHIFTTQAQTGNVFLAYRDVKKLNDLIEKWRTSRSPVYNFKSDDSIGHAIWIVNEEKTIDQITKIFKEDVPCTYIADGHHRVASAARVKYKLPDNKEAGYFLSTLFPASELKIMDYNRIIRDMHGWTENDLVAKLKKNFSITKMSNTYKPGRPHHFGMYLNRHWYELVAEEGSFATDPVNVLDISILQNNVLEPIFGIRDQRTDPRIDFIGGIRGMAELEKMVDTGEGAIAFSIYPVTIEQLFDIADSNNVMPPKSTWFEPKLRDGLLTHLIYE